MEELKNLERVHPDVQKKFVPFLRKFLALYPGEIRSVAIYGSATGQNYVPGKSDINSVVIMDQVGFDHLSRALELVAWGLRQKIAAPLLLTRGYVESSLDTFPIEFLDIKENHVLIYGEDFFSPLPIDDKNLRIFCEHQIKGKLIRIRQAYLEKGLHGRSIEILLKESLNSLIPIFRNLIRLKDQAADIDKIKILMKLGALFDLDAQIFISIHKYMTQNKRIPAQEARKLAESYIHQVGKLAVAIDKL